MNRKMKRISILLLAFVIAFAIGSCGSGESNASPSEETNSSTDVSSGTFDKNATWNDLGLDYQAFMRNPDDLQGEKVVFKGIVTGTKTASENSIASAYGNDIMFLQPGASDYTKNVGVLFFMSDYSQRFIIDDIVEVTGVFVEPYRDDYLIFLAEDIVLL